MVYRNLIEKKKDFHPVTPEEYAQASFPFA